MRVGSCAMSPFSICGGGCAGLIASFLPWKPNWDVLGCETQHVCWKSKGEERRGGPIRISAGLLCWYLFLVVSFLFFLLLWARFAGASCNFSSCVLDMFPSVSTYKVKGTCFLKPKVHGLAVAWLPSACGGLAGLCLPRFPPVSGSGCLTKPAEGY